MAASHLLFGSRNEQGDYYYREFWEQCQQSGVLAREAGLVTAFSRDGPQKVYVQHRVREHGAALWAALQQVLKPTFATNSYWSITVRLCPAIKLIHSSRWQTMHASCKRFNWTDRGAKFGELYQLLDCSSVQGAVIFVCGSASKMTKDVLQAFQQVLRQEAGLTADDAAVYLKQLELKGRYITEAWS